MLTDYERYQLEWMIEHGHSLDELMVELTYYQNDLEATRGVNLTVSDVFDAWTSDRGFASLENDVITKDMIRAGIEHGVIRFEANPDPNDPWKTVCAIGNGWFYHVDTTDIPPDEYILMNSRNVDMVVDEIYDELNSTVKSDYHDDFKRYLSVLSEEHHGGTNSLTGIPFDINETMENGGAYYNPERGIVIASFLLEQTSPRIEAYYGYTPYALASLIGKNADVTVDSDVMDIQDILADPSLPRRFDHEGASFDSVEELIASRWSPTGAGWLDMSGHNGLASAMGALDIKQTDNVREWYALAFPGDELAVAINPSLTFDDAIAAVPTGDGFYTALGDAADSLLRERIFEELCNRYGYTYDEVYDSWLHESPLPSPAISQQPEKIAVAAGYRFNLVDAREASGIDLKGCGTVVTVDGHDYEIMKGATYEDSRKVDDLLDSNGDKPISDYRKQPQGMSRTDDVFIASLVHYDYLDRAFSRIKDELRYLPDTDELRMVVSAADSLSRHYIEMGSNPVTEEEALEFIENCSKYPSYVIPGLDMPWEEYGPFGKVANDGRALEIINTLKRSSLATSLDDHPQGVSLKQAAMEAREASAKLFDKNVGADSPTRRDER